MSSEVEEAGEAGLDLQIAVILPEDEGEPGGRLVKVEGFAQVAIAGGRPLGAPWRIRRTVWRGSRGLWIYPNSQSIPQDMDDRLGLEDQHAALA